MVEGLMTNIILKNSSFNALPPPIMGGGPF